MEFMLGQKKIAILAKLDVRRTLIVVECNVKDLINASGGQKETVLGAVKEAILRIGML